MNMYNGVINVYKEAGYTSFDVVARLRGILKQKKIGHTGTLDPDATGVLPVAVGNATKLIEYLTDKKKEYIATYVLGLHTDTGDISGNILSQSDAEVTEEEIIEATASFKGDIMQIPPMYSALKVDGKKLYELAREGKEIERKTRRITIYEAEVLYIGEYEAFLQEFDRYYGKNDRPIPGNESHLSRRMTICMRVVCSKGTYIRTLCEDIGHKLGTTAVMTALKRSASGDYGEDSAHTLSEIENIVSTGDAGNILIPTESAFMQYPKVCLSGEELRLARNGNVLKPGDILKAEECTDDSPLYIRICDDRGAFFALYERKSSGKVYKPKTMFL